MQHFDAEELHLAALWKEQKILSKKVSIIHIWFRLVILNAHKTNYIDLYIYIYIQIQYLRRKDCLCVSNTQHVCVGERDLGHNSVLTRWSA